MRKKNLFIIRHKKEEKKHFEEYQIEICIIGFKAKKYHSEIIKHSLAKTDHGKIGIRYGYVYKSVNGRDMDTIYSTGDSKQKIIKAIKHFVSNEQIYRKNGKPYRLGFLLYGKPGTGKTSMAKAIATYSSRDINVINFKELNNLPSILEKISENEILLIEEIDTIVGDRSDPTKEHKELGNLLNLLDGVGTPENLIIIATTNHIEKLDSAITRTGRFDVKIELKYLTKEEAEKIFKQKGISINKLTGITFPIAPSDLQVKIINNMEV